MIYSCGCENIKDISGVTKCVYKCDLHTAFLLTHPETLEYYTSMGCIHGGIPHNKNHISELLAKFDGEVLAPSVNGSRMLEIGCGLGMYVPLFLGLGWTYEGLDAAELATYWVNNTFELFESKHKYEMVFSAHSFEHMHDAPGMLLKSFGMLEPGGRLVLVLPDDTDQTNPGHWWFFNQGTLEALLKTLGFINTYTTVSQVVQHEKFLYTVAYKPSTE